MPGKNGRTGQAIGPPAGRSAGVLGDDFIENRWKQQDMPSMARDFVNPGDNPLQLLMRTYLFSDQEINAAALFLYKCEKIHWKEGKELLLAKLAGRRSLGGRSMAELLALGIGSYPPNGIQPIKTENKAETATHPQPQEGEK